MTRRPARAAALAALLALAAPAAAHDGPPYPILVDAPLGPLTLSVWADPDVGAGTYYFYLERDGAPATPEGLALEVVSHPADDATLVRRGAAVLPRPGEPFQLVAEVEYDYRATWPTRFEWRLGDETGVHQVDVEVTPPGLGTIDVLWFAFPFLGIGLLWLKALLRRRPWSADPTREPARPDRAHTHSPGESR